MGDAFVIELNHEGATLPVEVILVNLGYSYRAAVTLNDIEVIYKPEENGHRAMIKKQAKRVVTKQEKILIELINDQLPALVKHGALAMM
jgi:hypothetical protein